MTLEELKAEAVRLNNEAHDLLRKCGYEQLGELDISHGLNPDEIYTYHMLNRFITGLDTIAGYIDQIEAPIVRSGVLTKNNRGRYELNGREFTCGSTIEFIRDCETPYWEASRIEARNGEYYLVSDPEQKMEGLTVRVKEVNRP